MYCDTIAIFSPSCPFTHIRYLIYLTEILIYVCMSGHVCTCMHAHTHTQTQPNTHNQTHMGREKSKRGVRADILTFFVCLKTNPIGTTDHKSSQYLVL